MKIKQIVNSALTIMLMAACLLIQVECSYADKEGRDVQVLSAEWQQIDSVISPNNNAGGGIRIFTGAKHPGDKVSRNTITVKAKTSIAKAGIAVHFKSFDVDDPSADYNDDSELVKQFRSPFSNSFVDAGDTKDETKGGDNRSGQEEGEIAKEGVFPSKGNAFTATTDADGYASAVFTVGFQPGDNYRVAASVEKDSLTGLNNDNVERLWQEKGEGNSSFSLTPLLTVWRRVHLEIDSMRKPTEQENSVKGMITRILPGPDGSYDAFTNIDFRKDEQVKTNNDPDNSFNLTPSNGANPGRVAKGRFQGGTLSFGGENLHSSAVLGNGINFLRSNPGASFAVPYTISNGEEQVVTGEIETIDFDPDGVAIVSVNAPLTPDMFNRSETAQFTMSIAGQPFGVESNSANQVVLQPIGVESNSANQVVLQPTTEKLKFNLHDDDQDSILPYSIKLTPEVNQIYSQVYIEVMDDGRGDMSNNSQNVGFKRNFNDLIGAFSSTDFQSESGNSNLFWIARCATIFQSSTHPVYFGQTRTDGDGNNESKIGAVVPIPSRGMLFFLEELREWGHLTFQDGVVVGIRDENKTIAHELGHVFGLPDRYSSGSGPGAEPCPIPGACGLMEDSHTEGEKFVALDAAIIRNRRKSPVSGSR